MDGAGGGEVGAEVPGCQVAEVPTLFLQFWDLGTPATW